MDDTIIIAEDYLLKQGVQVGVQRQDAATNEYYNDRGFANYVRLIGTEKQIEAYRATQDWEEKDNRKELVISRQVALYNATAYCNADKCSPEEILETANMFCTWIVSGQIKSNLHDKIPF